MRHGDAILHKNDVVDRRAAVHFYFIVLGTGLSDKNNRNPDLVCEKKMVCEKNNQSLLFSCSRKIPTLGSIVQWETRLVGNSARLISPWNIGISVPTE